MPVILMACPKCGKQATEYDDNKWQCLHCGVKFVYKAEQPPVVNVHQTYRSGEPVQSGLCCPKCGNTNVQLKPMIYQTGTHSTSGTGVGLGLSGGVGVGVWGGQSMSLLASRCKPPENGAAILWLCFAVAVGIGAMVALIAAVYLESLMPPILLSLLAIMSAIGLGTLESSKSGHHQLESRIWAETVVCLTCGHEFLTPQGLQYQLYVVQRQKTKQESEVQKRLQRANKREKVVKSAEGVVANGRRKMMSVLHGFDNFLHGVCGLKNVIVYRFVQLAVYVGVPLSIAVCVVVHEMGSQEHGQQRSRLSPSRGRSAVVSDPISDVLSDHYQRQPKSESREQADGDSRTMGLNSPAGPVRLDGEKHQPDAGKASRKGDGKAKAADAAMYYTVDELLDGKICLVIHNTPLRDKTSARLGAIINVEMVIDVPHDKKAVVLAGDDDNENQPVQIWFVNGTISTVNWNGRVVRPARPREYRPVTREQENGSSIPVDPDPFK